MIGAARDWTRAFGSEAAQPRPDAPPIDYYVDFDGYYFVSYARAIARGEGPRIRATRLDATPDGRPVYWSSAFPWWLVALGWLRGAATGEPLERAIASAACWASPLLLAAAAGLAAVVVTRFAGFAAGGVAALAIAANPQLLQDFGYAKPDHHGLHLLGLTGLLACALAGGGGHLGRPRGSARRWMIASGVFGGFGLWTGATQFSVAIAALGAGGAWACGAAAREPSDAFDPTLWRSWARAGAATALALYALEFLPAAPGMRLEVDHPLHALAWLGAGEVLARIGRARRGDASAWPAIGLGALAVSLLPAAVAFGPVDWFWPKDDAMLNRHRRIAEFAPHFSRARPFGETALTLGVPTLGALGALGIALAGGRSRAARARAVIALVPCVVLAGWAVAQARWLGWFVVAGVTALAALAAALRDPRTRAVALAIAAAVGLADAAAVGARAFGAPRSAADGAMALDILMRDLAWNLCPPDPHRGPVRVMTGPAEAARLPFFGRCRGVGTPFWENREGVRATAAFFTARDEAEAARILAERRIDVVAVADDVAFLEYMDLVSHGEVDAERVRGSFGQRLLSGPAPPGLVPIEAPGWPGARRWRLFRVAR